MYVCWCIHIADLISDEELAVLSYKLARNIPRKKLLKLALELGQAEEVILCYYLHFRNLILA